MEVPFLSTTDALRDLTSEMQIFTAMYLYRRCKMFAASGQEATSSAQASDVGDDVQRVSQQQGQRVRMILDETARTPQDVGYDPQPDRQDERLDQFSLRSTGYLLAKPNVQDASQTNDAPYTLELSTTVLANPTDTVASSPHVNLREVLAGASINDFDFEQEVRPLSKKRRRNADR